MVCVCVEGGGGVKEGDASIPVSIATTFPRISLYS